MYIELLIYNNLSFDSTNNPIQIYFKSSLDWSLKTSIIFVQKEIVLCNDRGYFDPI